jgi:ABC-type transport system substrate-binding protein
MGYERLGLVVKRQLQMVGVDMEIEEVSPEQALQALREASFDAVFLDMASGPSLFRNYQWWHSAGTFNPGTLGGGELDAPLDRIRHATSDAEYRAGVAAFQRAVFDNPPGLFLAWSERTRAVNRRFDVAAEPGRDILTTLRSWRPTNDFQSVGRN